MRHSVLRKSAKTGLLIDIIRRKFYETSFLHLPIFWAIVISETLNKLISFMVYVCVCMCFQSPRIKFKAMLGQVKCASLTFPTGLSEH